MKISRQIFGLLILFLSTSPALGTEELSAQRKTSPEAYTQQTQQQVSDTTYTLSELLTQHLEVLAKTYAEKGYRSEFSIGKIDPYHESKVCSTLPELNLNRSPLTQNRITTEIRCKGDKPWKLYLSAEFNIFSQTVIAANNIRRGQVITTHDIKLNEAIINKDCFFSNYL